MRQLVRSIGIWLGVGIFSAVPATPQEIKLTDYDVPVSQSHRLELTGRMRFDGRSGYRELRSSSYDLRAEWESFYNSLPLAWEIDFFGRWLGYTDSRRKLEFSEDASFTGSVRAYATEDGLLFAGTHTDIRWRNRYDRPRINLRLSAGLGRYIDATALAKALRIEEFLITEGILPGHLPQEALLKLASRIDRENEYKLRYGDTYTVWWYDDLEKAIASGATLPGGTIGALGLMRIRDVLEREQVRPRAYGWTVEAGVDVPVAHERQSDPGDAWPFVAASFAWPLGLRHQMSLEVSAASPTVDNFGNSFRIMATFAYSYELSNRIDLVIFDTYFNNRRVSITNERTNRLSLRAYYYLENRVTLSLSGSLDHQDLDSRFSRRGWLIETRIGYRIF